MKHDALRRRWNRIFKSVEAKQPPERLLKRLISEPHELRPYVRRSRRYAR